MITVETEDKLPRVITVKDAGDILHRGDVLGIRYDAHNRNWVTDAIIKYQTQRGAPYPQSEVSHVLVCSSGKHWRGYSMQPPRGAELSVRDTYHNAQLWVMRYSGWRDDEQRYSFVDHAAYIANDRYSVDGILRLATHIFPKFGGRFCSEQVELAAEQVGVNNGLGFIANRAADCTPAELACSPLLRVVAIVWLP